MAPHGELDRAGRGTLRRGLIGVKGRKYSGLPWSIYQNKMHDEIEETSRDKGSVQKDWVILEVHDIPQDFAIAVRAHVGWNHKEQGGLARYCLAVSFDVLEVDLPVYAVIENSVRVEVESEVEI